MFRDEVSFQPGTQAASKAASFFLDSHIRIKKRKFGNDTFHSKKRNVHSGVENLLSFNAPDVLMFDTIRYDGQISQATSEKKWYVKICIKRTYLVKSRDE